MKMPSPCYFRVTWGVHRFVVRERENDRKVEEEELERQGEKERVAGHPGLLSCLWKVHFSSGFTWGSPYPPG